MRCAVAPTSLLLASAACGHRAAWVTTDVPVGSQPVDVAAGDVDGDGAIDLVAADGGAGTVSVRVQRDGGWVAPTGDPFAADTQPHMVALGDLDGDGDLDLFATGHDTDGVWVWTGDGTGTFVPAVGSPFTAIGAADPHNHGLVVGDLDGDGDADVIVADQEAEALGVLLSVGGALVPAPGSPLDLGSQVYPPALGDLDGDGDLDVVAPLIGTGAVAVWLGAGDGAFQEAAGSPHPVSRDRPYAIALGDLDEDGRTDVIAPHDDAHVVSVLLADGDGRLRDAPRSPKSLGLRVWRGSVVDLDGDGHADLVAAGSGFLLVTPGDGSGDLGATRRLGPTTGWVALTADLDGDGRPDIVTTEPDIGALRVWTIPTGGP